jgi:cytochrome b6-f complex iron-sulfur subunit
MACQCGKIDRRVLVKAGLSSLAVAGCAGLYTGMRSLYPTVLYEPSPIIEIGPSDAFVPGEVKSFQAGNKKISVIRGEQGLYALVRNCTHMGCIPNYDPQSLSFLCPCHGSIFTMEGDVVKGPAPAPLFRAEIAVNAKGLLEVNAAVIENDPQRRLTKPFLYQMPA